MKTNSVKGPCPPPSLRDRIVPLAIAACSWMWLSTPTAQATLLLNGSFELPNLNSDGVHGNVQEDWSGGAFLFRGEPFPGSWPAPQHGDQFADIGNASTTDPLSQTFNVPSDGSYLLTWHDNAFIDGESDYSVRINDVTLATYSTTGAADWHLRSLLLTLQSGLNKLEFSPSPTAHFDALIDNVTLVPHSTSSPVPDMGGTFGLMSGALMGMIWLSRSRRQPQ